LNLQSNNSRTKGCPMMTKVFKKGRGFQKGSDPYNEILISEGVDSFSVISRTLLQSRSSLFSSSTV
ncbi:MAG: hypothetical protein ACQESP_13180, partial [Candidatus Muiribacteriota bacterium]